MYCEDVFLVCLNLTQPCQAAHGKHMTVDGLVLGLNSTVAGDHTTPNRVEDTLRITMFETTIGAPKSSSKGPLRDGHLLFCFEKMSK